MTKPISYSLAVSWTVHCRPFSSTTLELELEAQALYLAWPVNSGFKISDNQLTPDSSNSHVLGIVWVYTWFLRLAYIICEDKKKNLPFLWRQHWTIHDCALCVLLTGKPPLQVPVKQQAAAQGCGDFTQRIPQASKCECGKATKCL